MLAAAFHRVRSVGRTVDSTHRLGIYAETDGSQEDAEGEASGESEDDSDDESEGDSDSEDDSAEDSDDESCADTNIKSRGASDREESTEYSPKADVSKVSHPAGPLTTLLDFNYRTLVSSLECYTPPAPSPKSYSPWNSPKTPRPSHSRSSSHPAPSPTCLAVSSICFFKCPNLKLCLLLRMWQRRIRWRMRLGIVVDEKKAGLEMLMVFEKDKGWRAWFGILCERGRLKLLNLVLGFEDAEGVEGGSQGIDMAGGGEVADVVACRSGGELPTEFVGHWWKSDLESSVGNSVLDLAADTGTNTNTDVTPPKTVLGTSVVSPDHAFTTPHTAHRLIHTRGPGYRNAKCGPDEIARDINHPETQADKRFQLMDSESEISMRRHRHEADLKRMQRNPERSDTNKVNFKEIKKLKNSEANLMAVVTEQKGLIKHLEEEVYVIKMNPKKASEMDEFRRFQEFKKKVVARAWTNN